MIIPDVNLLLYAVNQDSPDHPQAFAWWKQTLNRGIPVRLTDGVVIAFVRLATNRRVFAQPLTAGQAFDYLDNWLAFPGVELAGTLPSDLVLVRQLLEKAGTAANLVSDAQIAAVALRLGARVCSADADFARFPGVDWENPLS